MAETASDVERPARSAEKRREWLAQVRPFMIGRQHMDVAPQCSPNETRQCPAASDFDASFRF
jgi:murein endopeptidase